MLVGVFCFEVLPGPLIRIFSKDKKVLEIGRIAFRLIALSFVPAVFSLTYPVFFQAIGSAKASVLLSITRQIFCLIPIFWILSRIGLNVTWAAFPISEIITGGVGFILYRRWVKKPLPAKIEQ